MEMKYHGVTRQICIVCITGLWLPNG